MISDTRANGRSTSALRVQTGIDQMSCRLGRPSALRRLSPVLYTTTVVCFSSLVLYAGTVLYSYSWGVLCADDSAVTQGNTIAVAVMKTHGQVASHHTTQIYGTASPPMHSASFLTVFCAKRADAGAADAPRELPDVHRCVLRERPHRTAGDVAFD